MLKKIIYFEKELIDHNGRNNPEPLRFEEIRGCRQQKRNPIEQK